MSEDWYQHAETDQSEFFCSLETIARKEFLQISDFYMGRIRTPEILTSEDWANEENQ